MNKTEKMMAVMQQMTGDMYIFDEDRIYRRTALMLISELRISPEYYLSICMSTGYEVRNEEIMYAWVKVTCEEELISPFDEDFYDQLLRRLKYRLRVVE